ncbi:polysaccharide lyase [Desulfuromonas soudanensis]|uniref:Polysaccharide lyase n=1 Tax=Desulfuromonas soudanensis TaxID=1603606 RepID=A0A0M4D719_9BACT|nr:heparin lyase I family protein [Desulfuromonas soudanensis]ALC16847.1 polysaccharide lyase [Desulfuromonas soudanensis]
MTKKIYITFLMILLPLFSAISAANALELFSDSFESGNLTHTTDGTGWAGSTYTSVVPGEGRTGNYALKFRFIGSAAGTDAHAEQRFVLGFGLTDIYIQYYIKFPSNYLHRIDSPSNNKFIRLWTETYSDVGQIGASAMRGNLSNIFAEAQQWECGPIGEGNLTTSWSLTPSDLGKWLRFEWRFKPDTGSGNGAIEFWVDGIKKFSYTNLNLCDAPYLKNGYLMGWSNSGFAEQTDIYIDDVTFSTNYIGEKLPNVKYISPPDNLEVISTTSN